MNTAKLKADRDQKLIDRAVTIATEQQEQELLIQWCDSYHDDRASLIYSHLNGMRASIGAVVKAKAAGARRGIPDLFLPVPSGGFHGLYIEMKRLKKGVVSPEQKEWISALKAMGYQAQVCKGHESAIEVIKQYLGASREN